MLIVACRNFADAPKNALLPLRTQPMTTLVKTDGLNLFGGIITVYCQSDIKYVNNHYLL
jgi:hypothetical protein